ncbi:MAG: tetratricopeptide repeat protein [Myxococcales bacterium]|nr:tetratricopeptide repeat protein [Myxococcales bacterium]
MGSLENGSPSEDPSVVAQRRRLEARLFGAPLEPVHVGRFALLRRLGSGAMGVVHLAYDEVLDRKVAIKLIRRDRSRSTTAEGMLREAQAMARLSHPNVVQVYEAGEHAGGVFVAMELVEGQTLREWLEGAGAGVPWRDRLARVIEAGRGLAEAHRAGVVHRDLKPDNVLLTARGEAKVSDFGLAGLLTQAEVLPASASSLERLACTAGVGGTPLYMAPEVFAGLPADHRSDQFGFCVMAHEAVLGVRPFEGSTYRALEEAVTTGRRRAVDPGTIDPVVLEAISRGLATDPADRWPSMDELLAALSPVPRTRTRLGMLLGLGLVSLAAMGIAVWTAGAQPDPCGDAAEHLVGAWDAERRDQVRAALEAGPAGSLGAETWTRIAPRLDAYAEAWTQQRRHACVLTRVHHEQSEEALELRRGCLDRARSSLAESVAALARGEPETIEHGLELVEGLPSLERCADPSPLRESIPPPAPEQRERVRELWQRLAESEVRRAAGDYRGALERAERAEAGLEGLAYGPVETEIAFAIGRASSELNEEAQAEAAFARAQQLALEHGQWELALDSASWLAFTLGARQRRFAEARVWIGVARGLLARDPSSRSRARFHSRLAAVLDREARYDESIAEYREAIAAGLADGEDAFVADTRENLGQTLLAAGHHDQAEAELRAALELHRRLRGPQHPKVVHALTSLAILLTQRGRYDDAMQTVSEARSLGEEVMPGHPGLALVVLAQSGVLDAQGRPDEAIALLEEALRRWEPILGPDHVTTISIHNNLGAALINRGWIERGEPHLREVVRGNTVLYGVDHPATADAIDNLGIALQLRGRWSEAEAEHRRALESLRARLGPRHLRVGEVESNLAGALAGQGRHEEASAETRVSLAILEATLGADHPTVAATRNDLATTLLALGHPPQAERELRAALATFERTLPDEHPNLVIVRTNLGDALAAQGDLDGARAVLERAVAVAERIEGSVQARADARRALAKVLRRSPDGQRRARELAERAREDYRTLPPDALDGQLEELDAWLGP